MNHLENIIIIFFCFFYFWMYYKAILERFYTLGYIISFFVGILLSVIGIGKGEMLSSIVLSCVIMLSYLAREKKIYINNYKKYYGLLLSISLAVFIIQAFISPAVGTEYFNQKFMYGILLIYYPITLLLLFSKPICYAEAKRIKIFFVSIGIITSLLLCITVINTNIDLSSGFMKSISLGTMNGIWLTRFNAISLILLITLNDWSLFRKVTIFLFIFISTLFTGSKILIYIVPIIILLLLSFSKNKAIKKYFSLIIIAVSAYALILAFNISSNIAIIRRFSLQSGTIQERIALFTTTQNAFFDSNLGLFGNGLATVGQLLTGHFIRSYPHNLLLELVYEFGYIGVLLFLLPFLYGMIIMLKKLIYKNRELDWVIWISVAYLLFSFTSGDLISNQYVFLMITIYICSIGNRKYGSTLNIEVINNEDIKEEGYKDRHNILT